MEHEINLLDLLAAAVRKGKQIILFAVIIGLLVMGYSYVTANFGQSEEEEAYAMEEKARKLRDLQKTVERAQKGIDSEREYIRDSLYMDLNPYDVYNTRVNYLVTDIDVPLDGSLGMMANPTAYANNRIIANYLLEWNGTDLQESLNLPGYQNVEDRFLRELVSIGNGDDGNIFIMVNTASEAESRKIAEAVEKLLLSFSKKVSAEAYGHKLVKVSFKTRQVISESIRDSQNTHYDNLDLYVDELSEAQKSIDTMESEHTSVGYVKKLIIGCLVGGILAALWVVFRSLVRGIAESAEQVAAQTGLQYLGNAVSGREKDLFAKLASLITGEKSWSTDEEALSYMAERTALEGRKNLLVTTTGANADPAKVEALLSALKAGGMEAKFLPSLASSAEALASLKDADGVLFAVTKSKTSVPELRTARNLAAQAGKDAIGYVMM